MAFNLSALILVMVNTRLPLATGSAVRVDGVYVSKRSIVSEQLPTVTAKVRLEYLTDYGAFLSKIAQINT